MVLFQYWNRLVELGGLILAMAKTLKKRNIDYQKDILVVAIDISDVCAFMTYIQLSLYGIPAIVYCGDMLKQEIHFKMETLPYCLQYCKFRKFHSNSYKKVLESKIKNKIDFKESIVKGNCQISLW